MVLHGLRVVGVWLGTLSRPVGGLGTLGLLNGPHGDCPKAQWARLNPPIVCLDALSYIALQIFFFFFIIVVIPEKEP